MSKEEGRLDAATGIPDQRRRAEGVLSVLYAASSGRQDGQFTGLSSFTGNSRLVSAHGAWEIIGR
jgi:hypothetical protein